MSGISILHQSNASLGEGPLWDVRTGSLYWVDIRRRAIHRFSLSERRQTGVWITSASPGCVALTADPDRLLVAAGCEIVLLHLPTGAQETLARLPIDPAWMRANDGRVDSSGRLWVGTMIDDIHAPDRFRDGRLFRVYPDGRVEDAGIDAQLPNGIGWSPDGRTMYFNDSTALMTWRYDVDRASGALSNPRVLFEHPAGEGLPDGLCVDAGGDVWSAQWNGWTIRRITPDGRLAETIRTPVQRPSSVAFCGPDLDRMAFTSAANGFTTSDFLAAPDAGSLFVMPVDAKGQPEHVFRLDG